MNQQLKNASALTSVVDSASLSAEILDQLDQYAGAGVSDDIADQALPLLLLLQSNSPQVSKHDAAYVEGAEPGGWLAYGEYYDGVEGVEVIPTAQWHGYLEWRPNRGGLVGRHDKLPPRVELITVNENGRERKLLTNADTGNLLVDTREIYLLHDGRPLIFSCPSTRHKFAREWMTYFLKQKHPRSGKVLPCFARRYRLTTVPDRNQLGHWFAPKFIDLGLVTDIEELRKANALHEWVRDGGLRLGMASMALLSAPEDAA
jgi:hypothetical protein